jgi:hypothetical protein
MPGYVNPFRRGGGAWATADRGGFGHGRGRGFRNMLSALRSEVALMEETLRSARDRIAELEKEAPDK